MPYVAFESIRKLDISTCCWAAVVLAAVVLAAVDSVDGPGTLSYLLFLTCYWVLLFAAWWPFVKCTNLETIEKQEITARKFPYKTHANFLAVISCFANCF